MTHDILSLGSITTESHYRKTQVFTNIRSSSKAFEPSQFLALHLSSAFVGLSGSLDITLHRGQADLLRWVCPSPEDPEEDGGGRGSLATACDF